MPGAGGGVRLRKWCFKPGIRVESTSNHFTDSRFKISPFEDMPFLRMTSYALMRSDVTKRSVRSSGREKRSLTLPWDSRGREVRGIVVRASEDILVDVNGTPRLKSAQVGNSAFLAHLS